MKKQPDITTATRDAFFEAFFMLHEKISPEKITVSEISRKAGYNRSTFYQYFKDIHDLHRQIEEDMIDYIKESIGKYIGNLQPDEVFIRMFATIFREKKKHFKALFHPDFFQHFSPKLKKAMIPLFAEKMELSTKEPSTLYLLDFYFSGILSLFARRMISPHDMTDVEFALLIRKIVKGMQKSELFIIREMPLQP